MRDDFNILPDTDLQFTANYTASPELRYAINFTTTGVYTIWLRGYAPNAAGDSVHLSLVGQSTVTPVIFTGFAPRTWSWTHNVTQNGVAAIEITEPGLYTLQLWMREDGLRLDRIILTTDSAYIPTGNGPAESEQMSDSLWN